MKQMIGIKQIQSLESEMLKCVDEICQRNNLVYYLHAGSALGAIRHKGPIPWDDDVDIIVPITIIDKFIDIMKRELPQKYIVYNKIDNEYNQILFPRICLRNNNPLVAYIDVFPLVGLPSTMKECIKFSKKSDLINLLYRFKYRDISKVPNPFKRCGEYVLLFFLKIVPFKAWQRLLDKHIRKYDYNTSVYVMNPCGQKGTKNIIKKEIYGIPQRVDYDGMSLPIPERIDEYLTHYYGNYMQYPDESTIKKGLNKKKEYNGN